LASLLIQALDDRWAGSGEGHRGVLRWKPAIWKARQHVPPCTDAQSCKSSGTPFRKRAQISLLLIPKKLLVLLQSRQPRHDFNTAEGVNGWGGTMASAEHEPIMGVWGQSPQRGPGAEPLVRGRSPLKLTAFWSLDVQRSRQI